MRHRGDPNIKNENFLSRGLCEVFSLFSIFLILLTLLRFFTGGFPDQIQVLPLQKLNLVAVFVIHGDALGVNRLDQLFHLGDELVNFIHSFFRIQEVLRQCIGFNGLGNRFDLFDAFRKALQGSVRLGDRRIGLGCDRTDGRVGGVRCFMDGRRGVFSLGEDLLDFFAGRIRSLFKPVEQTFDRLHGFLVFLGDA